MEIDATFQETHILMYSCPLSHRVTPSRFFILHPWLGGTHSRPKGACPHPFPYSPPPTCTLMFKAHSLDQAYLDISDMENRTSDPCACKRGPIPNITFPPPSHAEPLFTQAPSTWDSRLPLHPAGPHLDTQAWSSLSLPTEGALHRPRLHLTSLHSPALTSSQDLSRNITPTGWGPWEENQCLFLGATELAAP